MARKRKIPARKHHGVRDPLKQIEDKEKKLKNVVNNPPERGNDQRVSYKFQQFKKLADDAEAGKKIKRIHSGQEDKPKPHGKQDKGTAGGNKFRSIKRNVDESDEDYLRRVNRITSQSLKEAQYETKYGVNVIRDPKTGMITVKKKPKNEIDELIKQKQKDRHTGKANGKGKQLKPHQLMDPKMARDLVKQALKESNEELKKERTEPSEYKQDVFKFGEVVHAPPTISTLPRKAQKNDTVPRPGKKGNLLLKNLLNGGEASDSIPTATTTKSKATSTGKVTKAQMKGKRRDLPATTRSMLESEQSKIIELYRNLKKSKQQEST